jgi:NADH oxidase (H2O2-forming)
LGDKEVIEKESGTDYLRIILLDGKVIGGQAIGSYADEIGLFIGAMWRKDDMHRLRSLLGRMTPSAVAHAWPMVRLGHLLSPDEH